MVEIRLMWQNKTAISDTTTAICTIDVNAIGLTDIHQMYGTAYCDGCNAIGMLNNNWNSTAKTCTIQTEDWVTRATSYPTSTGQDCRASMIWIVQDPLNYCIDSFCDKFVWKRTA